MTPAPVVFLVDVDNTLLDNDQIQDGLKRHLEREFGATTRDRYWAILEALFVELGYRDYLGALQRYRVEHLKDVHLMSMSSYLVDYPFADRLYPGALDVIERLRTLGPTVTLSRYPAQHYVLIDDKPRILAAVKEAWADRVTTVFPRQGQYAQDAKSYRPADATVERIGDLLTHDFSGLLLPEVTR